MRTIMPALQKAKAGPLPQDAIRYLSLTSSGRQWINGLYANVFRAEHDLRQHRVAPPLAESTVRKVYEGVDEGVLIEEWIRRKYRVAPREGLFQEDKDLAAAYRRLARAGFRTGEIVKALKRFAKNPELLDSLEAPEEEIG